MAISEFNSLSDNSFARKSPAKKLDIVIALAKEHDITAYEIGKNTDLNISGVQKLLSRKVQKPRSSTLNIIYDYINTKMPIHKNNDTLFHLDVSEMLEGDYKSLRLRQYQAEAMAARVKAEVDAMKEILALPPRMQRLRNMARACALLERYHNAGYTTMHMFQNAVAAVYPKIPSIDLACFYDMAVFPDVFICNDVENALNVLKPGL